VTGTVDVPGVGAVVGALVGMAGPVVVGVPGEGGVEVPGVVPPVAAPTGVAGALPVPGPLGPAVPTPGATTTAGVVSAGGAADPAVVSGGLLGAMGADPIRVSWSCPLTSAGTAASGGSAFGSLGPGAVDSPSVGPTTCAVGREQASELLTARPIATIAAIAARDAREVMTDGRASTMPPRCDGFACASATACRSAHLPPCGLVRASQPPPAMPARSIDTATLAFGLVSIPVKIYSTNEPSHELHFHLIHEGCGERLHQQYVCPRHGVVERSDMIKGYELTKGNFVELSKSELAALDAVASDEIAIQEFVPAAAVDPLLVEHSYYLGPGKGAGRAYQLFRAALEAAELVAIASYAARGKQYVVELRPFESGLVMHQLRYPDEVKPWSEVPAIERVKPAAAELALARQVIDHLRRQTFDPSRYQDEVKARVRALIASKAKGGEITAPVHAPRAPVTDLMAALKASLGAPAPHRDGHRSGPRGQNGRTDGARQPASGRGAHASRAARPRRTGRAASSRAKASRPGRAAARRAG
jgi:DNA end-binding protein Ku